MIKWLAPLLMISSVWAGEGDQAAHNLFAESDLFPSSESGATQYAGKIPGADVNQDNPEQSLQRQKLQSIQSQYDENLENASKGQIDDITLNMQQQTAEYNRMTNNSTALNSHEIQTMMRGKHQWKIKKDDEIFGAYDFVKNLDLNNERDKMQQQIGNNNQTFIKRKVSSLNITDKIVQCKEAANIGEYRCTRHLKITGFQPPDIKQVITVYASAHSYDGHHTRVNLKTGKITVGGSAHSQNKVVNAIDKVAPGGKILAIKYLDSSWWASHTNEVYLKGVVMPSEKNGYTLSYGIEQGAMGRRKKRRENANKYRGRRYSFEVIIRPAPQLNEKWEEGDCREIENWMQQGACVPAGKKELLGVNETQQIPGYPQPVTRSHWAERFTFLCGGVNNTSNECAELEAKGCTQISSRVSQQVDTIPIEYEQTFRCGGSGYYEQQVNLPDIDTEEYVKGTIPSNFESFPKEDMGNAMMHLQVLREIGSEFQKDFGGPGQDENNPVIFKGKTLSCVKYFLGSVVKDCCNFYRHRGIFKSQCSEYEETADAVHVGRAHYVGEFCAKKEKISKVCIKKQKNYCVYNSKLTRIIHEIAKQDPQQRVLHEYNRQHGIANGWGSAKEANCGNMSVEQFTLMNLDTPFARRHMAQLFKEFEEKALAKIEHMRNEQHEKVRMKKSMEETIENLPEHFENPQTVRLIGKRPESEMRDDT